MRTRVQRWLSAPVFLDEEQTRVAGLLNLLLITFISLLLLDLALLLIFAPETVSTFWINGAGVLIACVLLWVMRRGRVRLAGIILCLAFWPLLAYYLATSGGLSSPTLGFINLFVVIGVTLFGTRGAVAFGLLNTVCLAGLYLAGSNGLLVSMEAPPTLSRLFATNTTLLLLLAALVAISGRSIHNALLRARNGERALAERNLELQHEIAERKDIAEALRVSREILQATIDVSPLAIILLDLNDLVQLWNPAAERIFGWTAQEVLGKPIPVVPAEYLDEYRSLSTQVFDGNQLTALVMSRRRKDGSPVTITTSSATLHDSTGKPHIRMSIVDDITDRRRAEDALRRSEANMRAILDNSALSYVLLDTNQRVIAFNRVAQLSTQTLFGRDIQPGDSFTDYLAEWNREDFYRNFAIAVHGEIASSKQQFVTTQGLTHYFDFRYFPAVAPDGQVLGVCLSSQDVTERHQAEESLRESEERYRVISQGISDYAYSVRIEPDGTMPMEWITESFTRITGYTLADMLDREMRKRFALFHPDDQPQLDADMTKLLRGELIVSDYRLVLKSGETRWMHYYRQPVWSDVQQRVVRYYGIAQDITERKRAEQDLQRRDMILEAVSKATNYFLRADDWQQDIGSVLSILGEAAAVDRTGIFQHITDAQGIVGATFRPEWSWSAPGIVTTSEPPLWPTIDVFGVDLGLILDPFARRQPVYFHTKNLPPDKRAYIENTGAKTYVLLPILLNGAIWGGLVLSTAREEREWSKPEIEALQIAAEVLGTVMERKQAEHELQQSAARLSILHQIDQAILAAESADEIAQAALQCIRQLIPYQYAVIEIIDLETTERVLLAADDNGKGTEPPGSRHPLDQRWLDTLSKDQPYAIPEFLYPLPLSENVPNKEIGKLTAIPLIVRGVLLGALSLAKNDPDIFAETYLEIGREVADQLAIAIQQANLYELAQHHAVELEARVKERTEQLEAANRAKSAFLANVNHELRTPLNAILGFANLLTHQGNLTTEQQENLNIIERSGQHLLDLINDVLDMSRIEAERVTVDTSNFDLYGTVREIEQLIALRAADKQLHVHIEITPTVPQFVISDQRKLRQILINLLGNAVKFTDQGSIVLRVSYAQEHQDLDQMGVLSVNVEDTGRGIADNEIGTLFEPFTQTESGRAVQQGTGLGLAITRQFVHILGGSIAVKSQIGLGTTFTFTIPMKPGIASITSTNGLQRHVVGLVPGQMIYRILVVDDSEDNRLLLCKLLRGVGFEVREAANGKEAIDQHEMWPPHLIFMDMKMPVMDGYEATRRIKGSTQGQAITIVALTASALEETHSVVLSAGCDDYLRKPLLMSELFTVLEHHLGVQFVYEDEVGESVASSRRAEEIVLTRADLLDLSSVWVGEFHTLAVMADSKRMLKKIEEIQDEYPQLAKALTTLVKKFRLKTILALTAMPLLRGDHDATSDRKS
jgi:PAS domain S-box-containing protein